MTSLRWIATLAALTLLLTACGAQEPDGWPPTRCEDAMTATAAEWGEPEKVFQYGRPGNYSEQWWYASQGHQETFRWGAEVGYGCDVTTYDFVRRAAQ